MSIHFRRVVSLLLAVLALASLPRAVHAAPPDPLGVTLHGGTAHFRVWAPDVDSVAVVVGRRAPAPMTLEPGHTPDDAVFTATIAGVAPGTRYVYRMTHGGAALDFDDPRATRLLGPGGTGGSVVTADPPTPAPFAEPAPGALVIYEMHVGTFHPDRAGRFDFAGATDKLDYLQQLGVNAVELMPIAENTPQPGHRPTDYDWGYDGVSLYAVNPSYGTPDDFARFVAACHRRKIAVILDVVYNHLNVDNRLERFGGFSLPSIPDGVYFYGPPRGDPGFGGRRPDYGRPQVRAFIQDNAVRWLQKFGVDGLRWDSTINIRAHDDGRAPIPDGALLMRDANDACHAALPGSIAIAEDLRGAWEVITPTGQSGLGFDHGLGFDTQWDNDFYDAVRASVTAVSDADRGVGNLADQIRRTMRGDAFHRVIYTENHDKVGHPENDEIRLPALIDRSNPGSVFARRRSALAASVLMTSPGIPMLFQGQEMLDTRPFDFGTATAVDWTLADASKNAGMVRLYHDLIALRRNAAGTTAGLGAQNTNVFHVDTGDQTLAYHRFGSGGAGDDVVVVVNLANRRRDALTIGFPRGGVWHVRFNSGATVYDPAFVDGDSFDTTAVPGARDGLAFNGSVGIGPYSVVVLSQ